MGGPQAHGKLNTETFSPLKRNRTIWRRYGVREDFLKVLFVGKDRVRLKGVPELLRAIEIFTYIHPA